MCMMALCTQRLTKLVRGVGVNSQGDCLGWLSLKLVPPHDCRHFHLSFPMSCTVRRSEMRLSLFSLLSLLAQSVFQQCWGVWLSMKAMALGASIGSSPNGWMVGFALQARARKMLNLFAGCIGLPGRGEEERPVPCDELLLVKCWLSHGFKSTLRRVQTFLAHLPRRTAEEEARCDCILLIMSGSR